MKNWKQERMESDDQPGPDTVKAQLDMAVEKMRLLALLKLLKSGQKRIFLNNDKINDVPTVNPYIRVYTK